VARHVVLLRGVNLGPRNRVSMSALRDALERAGFADVVTYLQSGNAVVSSRMAPAAVRAACRVAIRDALGLDVEVLVRSARELGAVVERNPLASVATDPKRYQVSFLERALEPRVAERVRAAAAPPEQVVVSGREIYAWHPDSVARSKLWSLLAGRTLGVAATARNWTTVTKLLALAEQGS
jgi:uncharacterized protein (DUF1697 family)